ncbi:MAG: FG-GAP repeat domain-containing protein [Acidobacteriota bacterium]
MTDQAGVAYPGWGMGACAGDYDGDGWVDLLVTCLGANKLYRNNGDGTFSELGLLSGTAVAEDGSEQGSMGIAVGDYDANGLLDLFVTNFSDEYNALYRHDRGFKLRRSLAA